MNMLVLAGKTETSPVIDGRFDGIFDGVKQSNSIEGTLTHCQGIIHNKAQMVHPYLIIITHKRT